MDERRLIGPYEIIGKIATGGMGTVYLARHTELNREVALKVLAAAFADDAEFVKRFRREAQATAALRHPHIVEVHDANAADGYHYIAMEYLSGGSLQAQLTQRAGAPFSVEQALIITRQIALALDYAHSKGFVHRDIKPSNIMIANDGRYVLTDFGIVLPQAATKLTHTIAAMGTPEYMSPEQAQGQQVDGRSDIYSLGIVLYEMLSGHVPFTADNTPAMLYKHVHEPPASLSRSRSNIPQPVQTLVAHALAKQPERRFQTAAQMVVAIDSVTSTGRNPAFLDQLASANPGSPIILAGVLPTINSSQWYKILIGVLGAAFVTTMVILLSGPRAALPPTATPPPSPTTEVAAVVPPQGRSTDVAAMISVTKDANKSVNQVIAKSDISVTPSSTPTFTPSPTRTPTPSPPPTLSPTPTDLPTPAPTRTPKLIVPTATFEPGCLVGQTAITSPASGSTVHGVVPIYGTVNCNNFFYYKLELEDPRCGPAANQCVDNNVCFVAGPASQPPASGDHFTYQVTNGLLTNLDTTKLPNGPFTLRLVALGVAPPGETCARVLPQIARIVINVAN